MAQHPIELILLKQWSSYIAIPIWIIDGEGNLVFYNEPAEGLLGRRFEEAGAIPAEELSDLFIVRDRDGNPVAPADLPIVVALSKHEPAHQPLTIRTFDGVDRDIEVTAFPIEGQGGRHLGAFAAFWETGRP